MSGVGARSGAFLTTGEIVCTKSRKGTVVGRDRMGGGHRRERKTQRLLQGRGVSARGRATWKKNGGGAVRGEGRERSERRLKGAMR